MPLTYRIDVDAGVVLIRAVGAITDDAFVALHKELNADSQFVVTLHVLCDLEQADLAAVTALGLKSGIATARARGRRAFVAASDVNYGVARMYASYAAASGLDVRVFHDRASAAAWLASPPG